MLQHIKDPIQNVIDVLSTSMEIDAAVIDTKFKLIAYTKGYIEKREKKYMSPLLKKYSSLEKLS